MQIQDHGRISCLLVGAVLLLWGGAVLLFGIAIIRSGVSYQYDWGYLINRASMHADFGRELYIHMEFFYGPLLFTFRLSCEEC